MCSQFGNYWSRNCLSTIVTFIDLPAKVLRWYMYRMKVINVVLHVSIFIYMPKLIRELTQPSCKCHWSVALPGATLTLRYSNLAALLLLPNVSSWYCMNRYIYYGSYLQYYCVLLFNLAISHVTTSHTFEWLVQLRLHVVKVSVKVKFSLCLTKHHAMKTYWCLRYSATHSWPCH